MCLLYIRKEKERKITQLKKKTQRNTIKEIKFNLFQK